MPIAFLQVFAIGFSMGLMGPCFFYCLPIILTLTAASGNEYKKKLSDILTFFLGRFLAYVLLGFLAGLSGLALRHFIDSKFAVYLKPLAGVISIILGIYILSAEKESREHCRCSGGICGVSGIFGLGFIIGLSPCIPLTALLFEIVLISKSGPEGALYGLFFGAGTFLSGFIAMAGLSGLLNIIPQRFLKSERSRFVFKVLCCLMLILFGMWLFKRSRI